jgi:protein TonB
LPASSYSAPTAAVELPAEVLPSPFARANSDPIYVALAFSVLVHACLLLIHFTFPDADLFKTGPKVIDVILVNSKSSTRPSKADALAQADLNGGGNTEADRRAKSNLPALAEMPSDAQIALAARRVQQMEAEAQRLMATLRAGAQASDETTRPVEQHKRVTEQRLEDLPDANLQIARLEAQIARDWDAYQKLPKRKFVGARTQSVVYAQYVDDWRERIERVGTANFPEEARKRGLFGTVLVTVAIKADGSVERVEIDRSSGSRVLDSAVERIVFLAAPFKPFPANVKRETDILHITRNWAFTRTDLLLN